MMATPQRQRKLVKEAAVLKKRSRLDEWYYHWVVARDYASHGDYKRASAEAKAAIAMAPYDTISHSSLSWIMSGAGDHEAAIAWATFGATHDPHPREWYFDDLLDAYDMADRWPDALKLAQEQISEPSPSKYWYKVLGRAYAYTDQMRQVQGGLEEVRSACPDPPEKSIRKGQYPARRSPGRLCAGGNSL